jgi:protein-L-isoaspartate(D-aspartate) O-methyltransferase
MGHRKKTGFDEEREKAVKRLIEEKYLWSQEVIRAMKTVPREEFIPEKLRNEAYVDSPLPIGYGQTISALHMVAMMAETLKLEKGLRILEVGCGSGYHAAVLAEIIAQRTNGNQGHVYSMERIPELVKFAKENLQRTHYETWVTPILGDGSQGYIKCAPYDRVSVTAAAPKIPNQLIEQLKEGGLLLIPVGNLYFFQELLRIRKKGGHIYKEVLGGVSFVPLKGKNGWK